MPQLPAALPGQLLQWYDENRRILPWREEVSPYRTWVSEIMLQQTRVAAVLPYFQRFMEAFPTVGTLAQADTERLMKLWEGLFLEPGERFDWPDPAAPDSGTEFCHGLRSQIAVLCDGTVVPCCLDSEGRLALGNLHRQELAEILASPRATAMAAGFSRRQPSEELCRRCGYAARFSR